MIDKAKIDRINELARKAKADGLTGDEQLEQALLRRQYIEAVKDSLRPQVEAIRYVEPDGSIVNPQTGEVEGNVEDSR